MSVLRSYVATASTIEDRNKAISIATACWSFGVIVGPGIRDKEYHSDYKSYILI